MAGISNWFSFTSKEDREERSAEYFKRMFPLGEQQKTKEEELLRQLISAKTSDGDKLYQMLIVREALLQTDEQKRLAQLKKWYNARLLSVYSEEDKGILYFIAESGLNTSHLEGLSTAEQLKQKVSLHWTPIRDQLKEKKGHLF